MAGASAEDAAHGVVFGGCDPQVILQLYSNLTGDVAAAVWLVRWQPGGGVTIALFLVGGAIYGDKLQRVVIQLVALGFGKLLGAGLPGVGYGDDVVDLYFGGRAGPAHKLHRFASVGVVKRAAQNSAVVRGFGTLVGEVALQDFIAHIARACVNPAIAELLARIAGFGRPAFDGEFRKCVRGKVFARSL